MTTDFSTVPPQSTSSREASTPDGESGAKAAVARVADEAPAQAARVVGDAKSQLSDHARRVMDDLRTQADDRAVRAAQGLRTLSTRADALASGRTEEAGNLAELAQSAGRYAQEFADRLDQRGVRGLGDDLARFGRQRPWAFIGLSLGAGFLAGRLVRTGAAVAGHEGSGSQATPQPNSMQYAPPPVDELVVAEVTEVRV